ncbi:MAG: nitrate ABC transporter, permease protein, partial [Delftia sp.]|nr:nitrate ABC transporter, permease protein [Delftia sp.]
MVSAVFHFPAESAAAPAAASTPISAQASGPAAPAAPAAQAQARAPAAPRDWAALSRAFWLAVLPPLCGLGLLVGVWSLVAAGSGQSIPGPLATWHQAVEIFSDPFYRNGPNDQGV